MSVDKARLAQLHEMAAMVFDARSGTLRIETQRRDEIRRQIEALDRQGAQAAGAEEGISPLREAFAFGYEQWAAARRSALNARLAAQTAICLEAADKARTAFGRRLVLEGVTKGRR